MRLSKHFTLNELKCRHCGKYVVDDQFVASLQSLRDACNFRFVISSWYRCPEHNAEVSKTGRFGPHTTGRAVDIMVYGYRAYTIISLAHEYGFGGIGIKQSGPIETRFIHLDNLTKSEGYQTRPWVWSY